MPGRTAFDVITADDWDDWPDLDVLADEPESEPVDDEPDAA